MTDYEQLVKALREYSGCRKGEIARITSDAAAAIEELEEALADECSECDYLVNENARLTTENNELKAELAGSKDAIRILKHNLEMKKPKRGEWVEDTTTYAGPCLSNYKCSLCGKICGAWRMGLKPSELPNWCGNCGADMRKMEIQK